jgi:hypothetical protein
MGLGELSPGIEKRIELSNGSEENRIFQGMLHLSNGGVCNKTVLALVPQGFLPHV